MIQRIDLQHHFCDNLSDSNVSLTTDVLHPAQNKVPSDSTSSLNSKYSCDVTVIIPLFNKEATLVRCIESIVLQTFPPKKIIIVDDLSCDRSLSVAYDLASRNELIEVIPLAENRGPAHARNLGALTATTTWIAFLDADDLWHPHFLEKVLLALEKEHADFGSSGRIRISEVDGSIRENVLAWPFQRGAVVDLTDCFWRISLQFIPINSSANIIRRDLFHAVGGFSESMRAWEDLTLWATLWSTGRFIFVNEVHAACYTGLRDDAFGRFRHDYVLRYQSHLLRLLGRSCLTRPRASLTLAVYLMAFSCRAFVRLFVQTLRHFTAHLVHWRAFRNTQPS